MSGRLLPCPFCGGDGVLNGARIVCKRCLAQGPLEQYGQEDGSNWNRRHLAASQPSQPSDAAIGPMDVVVAAVSVDCPWCDSQTGDYCTDSGRLCSQRIHEGFKLLPKPAPQPSDDTGTWNRAIRAAMIALSAQSSNVRAAGGTRGQARGHAHRNAIWTVRSLLNPEGREACRGECERGKCSVCWPEGTSPKETEKP